MKFNLVCYIFIILLLVDINVLGAQTTNVVCFEDTTIFGYSIHSVYTPIDDSCISLVDSTSFSSTHNELLDITSLLNSRKDEYLQRVFPLYPNPADKTVTLLDRSPEALKEILLYDCLGRLANYSSTFSDRQVSIDVRLLPPGIYLLNIIQEHDKNAITLVIRR